MRRRAPATGDGGVYVQGDYNTDNKKAAAVIGDAVNLLSNAGQAFEDGAQGLAGPTPAGPEVHEDGDLERGLHDLLVVLAVAVDDERRIGHACAL